MDIDTIVGQLERGEFAEAIETIETAEGAGLIEIGQGIAIEPASIIIADAIRDIPLDDMTPAAWGDLLDRLYQIAD